MATSRRDKAEHRAEDAVRGMREDLADGSYPEAVYTATGRVLSELAKLRRHRPADAALIHAEMAGVLEGIASRMHLMKPQRPASYQGGVPTAEDLLAVFATALARASGRGGA
jgi:hypothetical protein